MKIRLNSQRHCSTPALETIPTPHLDGAVVAALAAVVSTWVHALGVAVLRAERAQERPDQHGSGTSCTHT